ncbi:DUF6925 family protein [Sphingomonas jatrophae]|uniref:Uncharacterized protein n=1 Tax=Sphingomonas jatrophae TaxID=1166337 RepID=A0A1I6JBY8_9SPHN|nr:hypothetical protein [Sphingomonas jatrophae]SFR76424.1 hypothetical protein SAMN05192580_0075 [Sphingomonas jatrophae]
MQPAPFDLIADLVEDAACGFSIASFGVAGEFLRDADEPVALRRVSDRIEIFTARGGLRIVAVELAGLAWDSLSADGETWGHALSLCVPRPATPPRIVRALGPDLDAIRAEDRDGLLFDIGVGCGAVTMAVRTTDATLIAALAAAEGKPLLTAPGLVATMLATQPHRVLLSPAGRIEVYQPIPPADGKSPEGPHTHLLPQLIDRDRPHSANVPIPDGWQAALTVTPRSPWRSPAGERHPYDAAADAAFGPLFDRFGSTEDKAVERDLLAALEDAPDWWPADRRGRTRARILLRRLHAAGDPGVAAWRVRHDRAPIELEEGEEA